MKKLHIEIREVDNGYIVYGSVRSHFTGVEAQAHVARTIAELKTLVGALAVEAQIPEFKKPREEG